MVDSSPPLLERAARIIARSVVADGRARALDEAYGGGAFSATFERRDQLHEFLERPTYERVVYSDAEAAEARLGDTVVGAVARRRYDAVVVVDSVEDSLRLVLRGSGDRAPLVERVELTVRQVATADVARSMSDERAAAVDALARQRAAAVVGGERTLLFGVDAELDNEDAFDVVADAEFDEFVERLRASSTALPDAIERIVDVWRSHDPTTHVVVWVTQVDGQRHVDELWACARRSNSASSSSSPSS